MTKRSNVGNPDRNGVATQPIYSQKLSNQLIHSIKSISCDVVFGSPNMDCNGTGICRISTYRPSGPMQMKKDCRHTSGMISAAPNGKISIYFFRELLCINLYRKHFYKGVLEMTEPCSIPASIANSLNISGKKLLPGNYAVQQCEGYYRVDLNFA